MSGEHILRSQAGIDYSISKVMKIGRNPKCEIQVADPQASRVHATIWPDVGGVYLKDENSSNGTRVNGIPINTTVRLNIGDQISIGNATYIFTSSDGQVSTPYAYPPQVQTPAANYQPTAEYSVNVQSEKKSSGTFKLGIIIMLIFTLCVLIGGAGGIIAILSGGLSGIFSKAAPRTSSPVVAVALQLDGGQPLLTAYMGNPDETYFWLPAGKYYIEAYDQNEIVLRTSHVTIADTVVGGDIFDFPLAFEKADGYSDYRHVIELRTIANFMLTIDRGKLEYLEAISAGFSVPLYTSAGDIDMAELDPLFAMYAELVEEEDQITSALSAFEWRALNIDSSNPSLPVAAGSKKAQLQPYFGLLDKFMEFFGYAGGAGERASQDIINISATMNEQEKQEAFEMVPISLLNGVENFDQMIERLQNGELDNNAAQIRKNLYSDWGFQVAAQNYFDTNRPALNTAYQEGSELVKRGSELQVEVIKTTLGQSLPGIEQGFEYADKVNEWSQFAHDLYANPLGTLEGYTRDQIKEVIKDRIKADLLALGEVDEDLVDEMADKLSDQIVKEIPEVSPMLANNQGEVDVPGYIPHPTSKADQATPQIIASPTDTPFELPTTTPDVTPSPEPEATPEPEPEAEPDYSWIEPFVQGISNQLIVENYDPIAVVVFTDDLRQCLIGAVDSGLGEREAKSNCASYMESLELTPTLSPTPAPPTNFAGSWNSGIACAEADAPYTWGISLSQDDDQVTGTLYYHKCPGGGRAYYSLSGTATDAPTITLYAVKTSGRGDLNNTARTSFSFTIEKGDPPP